MTEVGSLKIGCCWFKQFDFLLLEISYPTLILRDKIFDLTTMTTKKHALFISEPMGNKPVTAIPGIGPLAGGRLNQENYFYAYQLYGQYLVRGKDEEAFREWFRTTTGESISMPCVNAFREWTQQYFM